MVKEEKMGAKFLWSLMVMSYKRGYSIALHLGANSLISHSSVDTYFHLFASEPPSLLTNIIIYFCHFSFNNIYTNEDADFTIITAILSIPTRLYFS